MSIADFKSKLASALRNSSSDGSSIVKKIESMSANFKSTPTIIARDLTIEGDLTSSGLIEIEGNIKGKINGNSIVLREDGFVEGAIIAESVSLRGKFDGTIKAKTIAIFSNAKVIGNIEYEFLSVEDGASIDGQFKKSGS